MSFPNGQTLLIIEDDDALRSRLAKSMHHRGFLTRTCSSVAAGLEAIDQKLPDFMISDLRLADGSGLDVVEYLTTRNPDATAIILTGYGNIPTAVAATRIGAVDYIAKPASAEEIVDALMAPKGKKAPAPERPIAPEEARLEHIEYFLDETGNNISQAARLLNMHRRTLQRILRRKVGPSNATQ
ncbi:response regulator transcription factor [Pseudopelagicola sp. nBUS_20]|uniref:response regulator transcription factor n=1 Tax=Pseudopelagicola sp. nBUS_20 TaxID=3395317 RepID=UPI003EB8460B